MFAVYLAIGFFLGVISALAWRSFGPPKDPPPPPPPTVVNDPPPPTVHKNPCAVANGQAGDVCAECKGVCPPPPR